jgi:integrase/recombinase XerC
MTPGDEPLTTVHAPGTVGRVAIPKYRGETAMRLSQLGDQYLKFFGARGASPRTIETYDLVYGQFVAFLVNQGKQDDVREFTPDNLEAFSTYLAEAGRKASSVNIKLAALHSLGAFGVKTKDASGKKYLLQENPLDRVYRPKRQKPAEKYLYLQELKALLALPKPAAAQLALELTADTGLRASELAGARVADLSLDGDRLILATRVKGGAQKTVTLGAEVSAKLLESLKFREAGPHDPVLVNEQGGAYTRTTLTEMVARNARRAGITRIPVRAHVLRHSYATLAVATGADLPTAAAMLNHAGLATIGRYVHRKDAVDAARDRVREILA